MVDPKLRVHILFETPQKAVRLSILVNQPDRIIQFRETTTEGDSESHCK